MKEKSLWEMASNFEEQEPNKLVGKWFHVRVGGEIEKQGVVTARIEEHFYLIQFFNWFDGYPSHQVIMPLQAMIDDWSFYETRDQMGAALREGDPGYGDDYPEVLFPIKNQNKNSRGRWPTTRKEVLRSNPKKCSYCGDTDGPFEVDHIIPRCQGGSDEFDNLIVACQTCNRSKGGRTPEKWKGDA